MPILSGNGPVGRAYGSLRRLLAEEVGAAWGRRGQLARELNSIAQDIMARQQVGGQVSEEMMKQFANLQSQVRAETWNAIKGIPRAGWRWVREPERTAERIGRGAALMFGVGTAYRFVTGGGPFRDRRGNFDIAGIPFI